MKDEGVEFNHHQNHDNSESKVRTIVVVLLLSAVRLC